MTRLQSHELKHWLHINEQECAIVGLQYLKMVYGLYRDMHYGAISEVIAHF